MGLMTPASTAWADSGSSLALLAVPHGGPIHTKNTFPDLIMHKTLICDSRIVRSSLRHGPKEAALFLRLSIAVHLIPFLVKVAVNFPDPEKISKQYGSCSVDFSTGTNFGRIETTGSPHFVLSEPPGSSDLGFRSKRGSCAKSSVRPGCPGAGSFSCQAVGHCCAECGPRHLAHTCFPLVHGGGALQPPGRL